MQKCANSSQDLYKQPSCFAVNQNNVSKRHTMLGHVEVCQEFHHMQLHYSCGVSASNTYKLYSSTFCNNTTKTESIIDFICLHRICTKE